MKGDSQEASDREAAALGPAPSGIPGFVTFDGSVDESLVDAMLAMKISDRLRTLSRYVDAVTRFRTI